MQLNRYLDCCLEVLNERFSLVWCEQRSHIFDTKGLCTCCLDPLCVVNIILVGKYLTCGIADSDLSVSALLVSRFDSGLKVSYIVERVKYPDDVDTVSYGLLNKILNEVISVVAITKHILSSEKHLELGVRHFASDYAKSFPGILAQKSDTRVKCRAAPDLCGIEAYLVKLGKDIYHIIDRHSCCKK